MPARRTRPRVDYHRTGAAPGTRSAVSLGRSFCKLTATCGRFDAGEQPQREIRGALETDPEPTAEGLYVKVEDRAQGIVVDRYKWIRTSFLSAVLDSGSHWLARPIVANQLADGVNLFAADP